MADEYVLNITEQVEEVTITVNEIQGPVGPPGSTTFAGLTDAPEDNALLEVALDARVPITRTLTFNAPLTGSGSLSANLSISLPMATALVDGYLAAADFSSFTATTAALAAHTSNTSNPHSVTAAQVGAYTTGAVDTLLANYSLTSHTHNLDALSDVAVSSPASGNVLGHNGSTWLNRTLADAGISAVGHGHSIADTTGLQAALDALSTSVGAVALYAGGPALTSLANAGAVRTALSTYSSAQVDTLLTGYSATGHTHATSAITGLDAALSAASAHAASTSNPHSVTAAQVGAYSSSAVDTLLGGYAPTSRTLTATTPIRIDGGASATLAADRTISILQASGSVSGFLSSTDWSTFNGKFSTPAGLTTNNVARWNGTTFVDSGLSDDATKLTSSRSYLNIVDANNFVRNASGVMQVNGSGGVGLLANLAYKAYANSGGVSFGHTGTASAPIHARATSGNQILGDYSAGINFGLAVDALGHLTISHTGNRLAIGNAAAALGNYSIAIGHAAAALANYSIGIGASASAGALDDVVIGRAATTGVGQSNTVIGAGASVASGASNLLAGAGATITSTAATATVLGVLATTSVHAALALGYGATVTGSGAMAFGRASAAAVANTAVFGSSSFPINTIWAGKGQTNATPTGWGIRGTGGSGTDIAGGGLLLDCGPGTGAGATGISHLRATTPGASSATLQSSYTNKLSWNSVGIGLHGATPVARSAAIADATTEAEAVTQLNTLLAYLRTRGDIDT